MKYKGKEQVTKALCYGTFAYFDFQVAESILRELNENYRNLSRFYIGNLPDKDRIEDFYYEDIDYTDQINDAQSPIGIWRSKDDVQSLAQAYGWEAQFHQMPDSFQGSHYRYDVILKRKL